MPEISRFLGIVIAMYFDDHQPPHFHALYAEHDVAIAIEDGSIIAGEFPKRALSHVREWRGLHLAELEEDWELSRKRLTPRKIAPLE
jgi:hypothetical protein